MLDKDLYFALNASQGVAGDLVGEHGEEQRHHPHPLPLQTPVQLRQCPACGRHLLGPSLYTHTGPRNYQH